MRNAALALAVACSLASACSAERPRPQAKAQLPVRVEPAYAVRNFRGAELDEMRARKQLAGVTYGTGCYCMPIYVVHGDEPEGTNLRGPECADASLAPGDSPRCVGLDPHGIEQEGRYLCTTWTLGPSIKGSSGASTLP